MPLLEKTITRALADAAASFPDREAIVVCHQKVRYTWSELDREATRVARGLAGLGLAPGDWLSYLRPPRRDSSAGTPISDRGIA